MEVTITFLDSFVCLLFLAIVSGQKNDVIQHASFIF